MVVCEMDVYPNGKQTVNSTREPGIGLQSISILNKVLVYYINVVLNKVESKNNVERKGTNIGTTVKYP